MLRHDTSPLAKAIKLDNGFLKVPITATRTGIFVYKKQDGSEFRELRLPEEVFSQGSMDSLAGVPVTNRHPSEMVNSKNAKDLSVGFTSDLVTKSSDTLRTHATITHEDMVTELEANTSLREVSCGYELKLDFEPGVYKGQRYDAIQRDIRYNHIAIVDKGRAGPGARIHMDGADYDFERIINLDGLEEDYMKTKIKIGGVEYEVSEAAAQAITSRHDGLEGQFKSKDEELASLRTDSTEKQAKIDALAEDLKKAKSENLDEEKIRGLVSERVALVGTVAKFCKDSIEDVEKKSDRDLMVAIIKSQSENFDAEGKEDSYLKARVDHMLESFVGSNDDTTKNNDGIKDGLSGGTTKPKAPAKKASYEDRRDAHQKEAEEAWTKPLGLSKRA